MPRKQKPLNQFSYIKNEYSKAHSDFSTAEERMAELLSEIEAAIENHEIEIWEREDENKPVKSLIAKRDKLEHLRDFISGIVDNLQFLDFPYSPDEIES